MDIARPVPHIQYLPGLCQGTEQWVITALAPLLAVEAHGCALGKPAGGDYRTIEVEGHPGQSQLRQPVRDQLPVELAQMVNSAGIHPRQRAADRGNIGQAGQTQHPPDHGIIVVIAQVLQAPVPDQQLDDQHHDHHAVAKDGADLQVAETVAQVLFQPKAAEQRLEQHQSRKGRQFLVFKVDFGNAVCFTVNSRFATLHADGLLWFYCLVGANNFTKSRPFFICGELDYLTLFGSSWKSPWVNSSGMTVVCDRDFIQRRLADYIA